MKLDFARKEYFFALGFHAGGYEGGCKFVTRAAITMMHIGGVASAVPAQSVYGRLFSNVEN